MIGTETEACAAVNTVTNVPVKPVPVTVKVAEPAVALVKGMVKVPVCPAVPLAVNVPVELAVAQLNVNVAGQAVIVTVTLAVESPLPEKQLFILS